MVVQTPVGELTPGFRNVKERKTRQQKRRQISKRVATIGGKKFMASPRKSSCTQEQKRKARRKKYPRGGKGLRIFGSKGR